MTEAKIFHAKDFENTEYTIRETNVLGFLFSFLAFQVELLASLFTLEGRSDTWQWTCWVPP